MAFQSRGAGVTTRSNPKTEYLAVETGENIAKGVVGYVQANGDGFKIAVGAQVATQFFVTTEAVDNTAGGLSIGAVGSNEFVTVIVGTGGTIEPGTAVKLHATEPGVVIPWLVTEDRDLIVGTFLRKEGGNITRASPSADDELFTDGGDFGVGTATATDVIEIQVR